MFGDTDKCWCGLGEDFSQCHKNRENEAPVRVSHLRSLTNQATIPDQCLHPEASAATCSGIIEAHTIQRSGPLAKIIGPDFHVLTFDEQNRDHEDLMVLTKIGWKRASTFPGFCSNHDGAFFHEVENEPFVGSDKQCFLLGYRAICHELYKKLIAKERTRISRKHVDKGKRFTDQVDVQSMLNIYDFGLDKGIQEISDLRSRYSNDFLVPDYSDLNYLAINFDGDLSVAVTGAFNPDFDIDGNRLQDIKNFGKEFEGALVSTIVTQTGGSLVFSWHESFSNTTSFFKSLLTVDDADLPSVMVELLFTYIENTYFSDVWWNSLDDPKQSRVRQLASIPMAYENFEPSSKLNFVNWQITGKASKGI